MFETIFGAGIDLEDLLSAADASLKVYEDQPKSAYGISCTVYENQSNPNQVIVAFRGTADVADLATDAGIAVGAHCDRLKSHTRAICDELKHTLVDREVLITGHSLGGATAIEAALHTGWSAVAFDPPGFASWKRIAEKPDNVLIVDSSKNRINRSGREGKRGFKRVSLSEAMNGYLADRPSELFASHRMTNIRAVLDRQVPDTEVPEFGVLNNLRHDLSVSQFNVATGVYGKQEASFSFFTDKWQQDIDDDLSEDLAALTSALSQPDDSAKDAATKREVKGILGATKHAFQQDLRKLQSGLKFWKRAKPEDMDDQDQSMDPETQAKIDFIKKTAATIKVEAQRLLAAHGTEKKRAKALEAYRQSLNAQMESLDVEFNELEFKALAANRAPDFSTAIDCRMIGAVRASYQTRCDAQRKLVRSFSHAQSRGAIYGAHAAGAQGRHQNYKARLESIQDKLGAYAKPSWLHVYGNYQQASADALAKSGHPLAIAAAAGVRFGNGLLQDGRAQRIAGLQNSAQVYAGLDQQAQAAYSEAMGMSDQWMNAAGQLASVFLQNPALFSQDVGYRVLVSEVSALKSKEKEIIGALEKQDEEIARLEQELVRFANKEKTKSGSKKRRVQEQQATLREQLAAAKLKRDQLHDAQDSNRDARRAINPTAAAIGANQSTLSGLDNLIQKYSAQEDRVEDQIFETLSMPDSVSKDDWDNQIDDCFADACDPDKSREESREAFADDVVKQMAAKGITITKDQAYQIYDDKLDGEGKRVLAEKLAHLQSIHREKYGQQDQLVGEGFSVTNDFLAQLRISGLLDHIPGVNPQHLASVTKVVNMGNQAYQIYALTRDTVAVFETISALKQGALEDGTNVAVSVLTLNYVQIAFNLVKITTRLLATFNTAADKHPEFGAETQAVLAAIREMRHSLESRFDTVSRELGYIREGMARIEANTKRAANYLEGGAFRKAFEAEACREGSSMLELVRMHAESRSIEPRADLGARFLVSGAKKADVTGSATNIAQLSAQAYLCNSHLAPFLPGLLALQAGMSGVSRYIPEIYNPIVLSNTAHTIFEQPTGEQRGRELAEVARAANAMIGFSNNLRRMQWAQPKFERLATLVSEIYGEYDSVISKAKTDLEREAQQIAPCDAYGSKVTLASAKFEAKYNQPNGWMTEFCKQVESAYRHGQMTGVKLNLPLIPKGPNKTHLSIQDGTIVIPCDRLKGWDYLPILLPDAVIKGLPDKSRDDLAALLRLEKTGLVKTRLTYDLEAKTATAQDKSILYQIQGFGLIVHVEILYPGITKYQYHSSIDIQPFIPVFDSYDTELGDFSIEKYGYQHLITGLYGVYFMANDKSPVDVMRGIVVVHDQDNPFDKVPHAENAFPPVLILYTPTRWVASKFRHNYEWAVRVMPGCYEDLASDSKLILDDRPYTRIRHAIKLPTDSEIAAKKPRDEIKVCIDVLNQFVRPEFRFPRRKWNWFSRGRAALPTPFYASTFEHEPSFKPIDVNKGLHAELFDVESKTPNYLQSSLPSDIIREALAGPEKDDYEPKVATGKIKDACNEYCMIYATFMHMLRAEFDLTYAGSVSFLLKSVGLLHPLAFNVMVANTPEQLPSYKAKIEKMQSLDWAALFATLMDSHAHQVIQNLTAADHFDERPPVLPLAQSCEVASDWATVCALHAAIIADARKIFARPYTAEWVEAFRNRDTPDIEGLPDEDAELDTLADRAQGLSLTEPSAAAAAADTGAGVSPGKADAGTDDDMDELTERMADVSMGGGAGAGAGKKPSRRRRPRGGRAVPDHLLEFDSGELQAAMEASLQQASQGAEAGAGAAASGSGRGVTPAFKARRARPKSRAHSTPTTIRGRQSRPREPRN